MIKLTKIRITAYGVFPNRIEGKFGADSTDLLLDKPF